MDSKKIHYKMYKAGKRWLFAGIIVVSFGLGSSVAVTKVNADSTSTTGATASDNTSVAGTSQASTSTSGASSSSETAKSTETSESSNSDTTNATETSENTSSVATSATETSESTNSSSTSTAKTSESTSSAATTSEDASNSATNTSDSSSTTSSSQSSTTESTVDSNTATTASSTSSSSTSSSSTNSSSNSSAAVSSSTESTADTTTAGNAAATTSSDSNSVQVSYTTLLDQLKANTVLASENDSFVEVTKDNFLDYFTLNGSATYDATTGIVTLTPDENNQVGNFSLNSEINMNTSFTLTGSVNLGSDPNGADGIGFAFHTGNTNDIGNAGGNLGIGGLQNAIGFKLDTWNNGYQAPNKDVDGAQVSSTDSNGFGWNGDSMSAPYGTFVTTSDQEIKTADGTEVQRWWAEDQTGTAKSLSKADINGQFHNFVVAYDGATRVLTISYTQTSGKVLTWSTTVDSSYEAMAMVVSASTGGAKNLQQFKIDSFDFQQAATVNVTYVDQNGNVLATGEVDYPDGPYVDGTYTTEQKDIANYKFIGMADGTNTTTGLSSIDANGTLNENGNNGTVVYVYAPDYQATSKTVNETINYVDQNGKTVAESSKSAVTFVTVTNPVDGSVTYYYKSGAVDTPTIGNDGIPEGEGWTQTDSGNFAEVANPTVAGYKVISNDAPASDLSKVAAQQVTNDSSDLNYTVVYAPAYAATTKTVNETINYVDQNGKTVADAYKATPITFVTVTNPVDNSKTYYYKSGAVDTPTIGNDGVPEGEGWTKADSTGFSAVANPTVAGYKVISNDAPASDLSKVATQSVTADSSDLNYTVVYAPAYQATTKTVNETINYVDQSGKAVADTYKATPITFVTVTNPVDGSVTYYYKSGAIDTPTIGNDGVPEGEGWTKADSADFSEVANPNIANYEVISNDAPASDLTKVAAQQVTTDSSDLNYTVVYKLKEEKATVKYIDDTTNTTLTSKDLSGAFGSTDDYRTADTIKYYENKGYVLVSDNYPSDGVVYDQDGVIKSYEVHLVHGTTPINPDNPQEPGEPINPNDPDSPKWPDGTDKDSLTKTVTETVHYKYEDGTQAAPDKTDSVTFEHEFVIDNVTGEIIKDNGWKAVNDDTTFDTKVSPIIDGYTADKKQIDEITGLTQNSADVVETVIYTKNAEPVIPDKPVTPDKPVVPDKPVTPDKPVVPDKPVTPDQPVTPAKPMTPSNNNGSTNSNTPTNSNGGDSVTTTPLSNVTTKPASSKKTVAKVTAAKASLPQTGDEQSSKVSVIGAILIALASIGTLFGLGKRNKKESK
ncbi:lectin-like domain-containing protein [Liquorilactobacillus mali]|nr:MucBP domain-containing protein [Liquorilactobacillus mali]